MIEIFKHQKKWRLNIKNETLQFENRKELEKVIKELLDLKENKEPYK